jgi:hypothetical protein
VIHRCNSEGWQSSQATKTVPSTAFNQLTTSSSRGNAVFIEQAPTAACDPGLFSGVSGYGVTRKKRKHEGTVDPTGKKAELVSDDMTYVMASHLG